MADIINLNDKIVDRKLKPALDLGWLREVDIGEERFYGLTDTGSRIITAVLSIMFLDNEIWKNPKYINLAPRDAGMAFGEEVLSEEPFGGSAVIFLATLSDKILNLGIETPEDAEYLLEISRQYSDYGKNTDPVD